MTKYNVKIVIFYNNYLKTNKDYSNCFYLILVKMIAFKKLKMYNMNLYKKQKNYNKYMIEKNLVSKIKLQNTKKI